jgi:hypothetical protein
MHYDVFSETKDVFPYDVEVSGEISGMVIKVCGPVFLCNEGVLGDVYTIGRFFTYQFADNTSQMCL